jgi:hypothetical protein
MNNAPKATQLTSGRGGRVQAVRLGSCSYHSAHQRIYVAQDPFTVGCSVFTTPSEGLSELGLKSHVSSNSS